MARSAGFEPTASASAGLRSIRLSYERAIQNGNHGGRRRWWLLGLSRLVPKVGFEPTRPCGHYALNVACLPFHHFGTQRRWWAMQDLNLRPLPCEGSALATELIAP